MPFEAPIRFGLRAGSRSGWLAAIGFFSRFAPSQFDPRAAAQTSLDNSGKNHEIPERSRNFHNANASRDTNQLENNRHEDIDHEVRGR
jgi:hypothetical protein